MNLASILLVALGGALGAVARYGISRLGATADFSLGFPLPTLFVNITGSALLGALFGLTDPDLTTLAEAPLLLFAGVGFCGAYTTFSSFCTETVALVPKSFWRALTYVSATILGSVAAFTLFFSVLGAG